MKKLSIFLAIVLLCCSCGMNTAWAETDEKWELVSLEVYGTTYTATEVKQKGIMSSIDLYASGNGTLKVSINGDSEESAISWKETDGEREITILGETKYSMTLAYSGESLILCLQGDTYQGEMRLTYRRAAGEIISEAVDSGLRFQEMDFALNMDHIANVISVSPDGNKFLCEDHAGQLVIFKQDTQEYINVWFDEANSVPDEYGTIALFRENLAEGNASLVKTGSYMRGGVEWSPDGSMISLTDWYSTLISYKYTNGVWIVDTETGALKALSTTGQKPRQENVTAVYSSCFAEDGETLFVGLYNSNDMDYKGFMLKDKKWFSIDPESEANKANYFYRMATLNDVTYVEGGNASERFPTILKTHTYDENEWINHNLSLNVDYDALYLQVLQIDAAENTGLVLYRVNVKGSHERTEGFIMALAVTNCEPALNGYDRLLVIRNDKLSSINANELLDCYGDGKDESRQLGNIWEAVLSPDGKKALLRILNEELYFEYYILDTTSLNLEKVSTTHEEKWRSEYDVNYCRMWWCEDGHIYLRLGKENFQCVELQGYEIENISRLVSTASAENSLADYVDSIESEAWLFSIEEDGVRSSNLLYLISDGTYIMKQKATLPTGEEYAQEVNGGWETTTDGLTVMYEGVPLELHMQDDKLCFIDGTYFVRRPEFDNTQCEDVDFFAEEN